MMVNNNNNNNTLHEMIVAVFMISLMLMMMGSIQLLQPSEAWVSSPTSSVYRSMSRPNTMTTNNKNINNIQSTCTRTRSGSTTSTTSSSSTSLFGMFDWVDDLFGGIFPSYETPTETVPIETTPTAVVVVAEEEKEKAKEEEIQKVEEKVQEDKAVSSSTVVDATEAVAVAVAVPVAVEETAVEAEIETIDVSIPYMATAQIAYEQSDKSMPYDKFESKFLANAIQEVIAKQPVDISIPYDSAAQLAYDRSDKSVSFADFKPKYIAKAIEEVIAKQPVVEEKIVEKIEQPHTPVSSSTMEEEVAVVAVEEKKEEVVAVAVEEKKEEAVVVAAGVVQWYNGKTGFGFIRPFETSEEEKEIKEILACDPKGPQTRTKGIFVHHSAIQCPTNDDIHEGQTFFRKLYMRETVDFDVGTDPRNGRPVATNVTGPNGINVKAILKQKLDKKKADEQSAAIEAGGE
ncbi:hypothetical protein FRACYDRAFT_246061 [Fragilariopsis cylindrus CCMP1102]|uniref:CSD domain-containing protein n=1 Tax=Fragilariopsis cylindrus CCMP1102 TaxID=635003 RepID=A0A1E7EY58_9STRA|nr:hypothetical protein FRACYDRAFT_246061 [Fragilariopsis cylindrus CCMP1102]|eukprot:OEU10960.1 hypothetical protein FRACYDRAFT_246061 [Fragilariopsis cylindrus CCMP1102]